jgi:hypothetical protein
VKSGATSLMRGMLGAARVAVSVLMMALLSC